MTQLGADPEALETLAAFFETTAAKVETEAAGIDRGLGQVFWQGNHADGFRSDWQSTHSPGIRQTVDQFRDQARLLRENAVAQRTASEASGGPATGGSGPQVTIGGPSVGGSNPFTTSDRAEDMWVGVQWDADILSLGVNEQYVWDGPGSLEFTATAQAGLDVDANAGFSAGPNGFEGGLGLEANIISFAAGAAAMAGPVPVSANVEASVGVDVQATAGLDWDNGVSLYGDFGAFAGGQLGGELAVGSEDFVQVTGGAEGWVGIGWEASGEAALGWDEVGIDWNAGAALGIGGSLSLDLSFSPSGVADSVGDAASSVGSAVSSGVSAVGGFFNPFD